MRSFKNDKKKLINFDLSKIADGGVQEKFSEEVKKVSENILDRNTDFKKKRTITITLSYLPNEKRDAIAVEAEVKSKIAPQRAVATTLLVGRDVDTGVIEANELKSGVKGQTYFDTEDSTLKTDKGEPVEEVEKKEEKTEPNDSSENIIDLQKQNKKA